MKRISSILITLILFTGASLKSQTPEGATTALNYSGLESKLKKSDADIQDAKKNTKAKTWTSRASLLVSVYNVHNDVLSKGIDPVRAKIFFKEPIEIQTTQDGDDKIENYVYDRVTLQFRNGALESWTDTKKIHPDPLAEARKSIDEALKLNADGKATADIVASINSLKAALETEAILTYEKRDFKSSYENFIKFLDLNKLPPMNNQVDTLDIYYAGRAALENQDYKEANRLFEEAASHNYSDPYLFVFRKQSYFADGDTTAGVRVINEGFNKYPDNQSIMIELINYYLVSGQSEEALKLLAKAKAGDPENVSYTFAEGTLYDKIGNFEEAEKAYKTCIEMEPEFYDAQYNLGVLYYNKAVKIYEEASKITDNTEFEKASAQGNEVLLQAVPYMERASQLDPKDKFSLETLKTIFYRMKMTDKYNEVVSKLNNM
jgi:tetratricopeptide (TPR) repeat protein